MTGRRKGCTKEGRKEGRQRTSEDEKQGSVEGRWRSDGDVGNKSGINISVCFPVSRK